MKPVRRVGVRDGYDLWAATYNVTQNPVVVMDSRYAIPLLNPRPGEWILDAGCGTGRNLTQLAGAGVYPVGLDFSSGMLREAKSQDRAIPLVQADLQQALPLAAGCFDAVLCTLIGEHLPKLGFCLGQFFEVLRPGGRMVFTVYHPKMAAAGIEANFDLNGVEHRLGAELHRTEDYLRLTAEAGFGAIHSHEFCGDERLATVLPKAASLIGRPVILAVTAVRGT